MPIQSINKPSFIVTLLKVEVLLIGGWQLLRGVFLWQQADLLESYEVFINLRLLGTGAFVWSALFLTTAVTAHRKNLTLLKLSPSLILFFIIYSTIIQWLANQTPRNATYWSSTIVLYIILISINFWLRSLMKER